MFIEERQQEIAEWIKAKERITIQEITEKYSISEESARRDLRMLEKKGLCKRTHGGAILASQINVMPARDRKYDQMPVYDNYQEIAKNAVSVIKENDTVYMTGGSFGYLMLSFLPKNFHYTLVVNNVDIAKELRAFDNIDVYLAGGKMRQSGSLVDSLATDFISRLHFDLCFITGAGVTADFGLTNGTDETAHFQRTVIQNSVKRYLLMPGAKVGSNSFIKVCDAKEFDEIITDWECLEEHISALEEEGVAVHVVSKPDNA